MNEHLFGAIRQKNLTVKILIYCCPSRFFFINYVDIYLFVVNAEFLMKIKMLNKLWNVKNRKIRPIIYMHESVEIHYLKK